MPKPRPVFPKEKTISLQASILFSITSFLETPLTKKQFIATCFVCAGAAYLYQKEYYPKLSCAPILNLFKKKSETKVVNDTKEELRVPNNSSNDNDMNELGDDNTVSNLGKENKTHDSSDHISEEETKSVVEQDKKSQKTFYQRVFG